jgi:hypothetical protein
MTMVVVTHAVGTWLKGSEDRKRCFRDSASKHGPKAGDSHETIIALEGLVGVLSLGMKNEIQCEPC